jgi:hypothetical protein
MKLLIFLLLAFAALVVACPPPFNDMYYIGNETHTTADLLPVHHVKKSTDQSASSHGNQTLKESSKRVVDIPCTERVFFHG